MKKLGWYAVSVVVTAFILGSSLLLVANLYVQSRGVQQRIRQALSVNLKMPVSLKKTTFTPWDGLRIDGLTARPDSKPATGKADGAMPDFLTASSFRVRFGLKPLLRGKLVIADVLLDRPQLAWAQDRDNRWRLPPDKAGANRRGESVAGTAAPEKSSPPAAEPSAPPEAAPRDEGTPLPSPTSALADQPALAAHQNGTKVTVDKIRLRNGNMTFLNHKRGLLGRFEDVDMNGHLGSTGRAEGFARFSRAALPRAGIKLTHFQSDFVYDQKEGLDLRNAQADLAGGRVSADYHLQTGEAGSPYHLKCRLEDVSLDQLIKEAGGRLGLVNGRLQGELAAQGSDDFDRTGATGQFQLIDAQFQNLPLFQAVGTALGIDDLRQMRFKKAQLDYHLEGMALQIDSLVLVSNNLQVTAHGSYLLRDDRLDLHARLVIDEAVSRQLPQIVDQQFAPCGDEAPGGRFVDFKIGGPLNKPTNNLYQRMLPNTVNGLLDSLLHPKSRHAKPKPHPEAEPLPPPTDDTDAPGT